MNINDIIENYESFKAHELTNRFFKHDVITSLLKALPASFNTSEIGKSLEERSINLVKWGNGKTKVMLWSQMHGDEPTGTMALFDLINFLQRDNELTRLIRNECELHLLPMINPDGAERFIRRNAQQIDINRDYLQAVTPEAQVLKNYRHQINPEFGFNLHDQTTLWSVTGTLKPASLSFLAPALDAELSISPTRKKAMLVIADIFDSLTTLLPQHIGLFDDEFEPRAFGDNFQKSGTSTILIEAGGRTDDPEKQELRVLYFTSILKGLISISSKSYLENDTKNYFSIPKNNKQIFHILIKDIQLNGIITSIGINYDECPTDTGLATTKTYSIQDIGDLNFCDAYQTYDSSHLRLEGDIVFNKNASFKLFEKNAVILCFEDGKLL
ncbi:MAG: carboxypeptidase [Pedobacter sp.]|nr:MAG: carboxypeptidase [Pedobacter sp.]